MTIKHEIKSQLAKLLATEDLVVEHRKVETAEFNVQTRVLTLPLWDKASENVIDMLVSHEVGHALYTPDEEWWEEYQIHPSFVNIVEDARIEKLMKRRYDGISKTFYKGYTELHNDDFFQVKKKNISEMILADRVNLHYKIGTYYDIPFSSDERSARVAARFMLFALLFGLNKPLALGWRRRKHGMLFGSFCTMSSSVTFFCTVAGASSSS